jgi:O-antigen/teichoic acid export membrane protein
VPLALERAGALSAVPMSGFVRASAVTRKNVVANYCGSAIVVLCPLLALPYYVRVLGPAGWGLLSFALTLVALLGLIEVGLGQRLTRDIALAAERSPAQASSLLKGLERVYWAGAALLACILAMAGPLIANGWIKGGSGSGLETTWFAAALLLTQLPSSVYRSALLATDGHVPLNVIASVVSAAKHLGGIVVILLHPSIEALFVWLFALSTLETAARRQCAWSRMHTRTATVDWPVVGEVLKKGLSLSAAALVAVFVLQLDRLLLSTLVTMDRFGHYTIAYSVSSSVLQVMAPLMVALAPTFALRSRNPEQLDQLTLALAKRTLVLIAAGACLYLWLADALLNYWLGSRAVTSEIKPILDVLMIGSALNLLYQIGYQRWVASGRSRPIAIINFAGLLCSVGLTPLLVPIYGPVGAASGWIAINLLGAVCSFAFAKQAPRVTPVADA